MGDNDKEIERIFGEDRVACVFLNKDGQVGVLYGDNATITSRPEIAAKVLELVGELSSEV